MNKKKFIFELLYVVLIISIILFMIWMVFWLRTESSNCVRDPVTYLQEKNEEAVCVCYKIGSYGYGGEVSGFANYIK